MKNSILIFLGYFFLLTACSSSPSWNASVEQTPTFTKEQTSFIALKITDDTGQLVKGLQVSAIFEMMKMDHGIIEADLEENGQGIYQGNLKLVMGGLWQATITMTDGNQTKEQTVTFDVKEMTAASKDAIAQESIIVRSIFIRKTSR